MAQPDRPREAGKRRLFRGGVPWWVPFLAICAAVGLAMGGIYLWSEWQVWHSEGRLLSSRPVPVGNRAQVELVASVVGTHSMAPEYTFRLDLVDSTTKKRLIRQVVKEPCCAPAGPGRLWCTGQCQHADGQLLVLTDTATLKVVTSWQSLVALNPELAAGPVNLIGVVRQHADADPALPDGGALVKSADGRQWLVAPDSLKVRPVPVNARAYGESLIATGQRWLKP